MTGLRRVDFLEAEDSLVGVSFSSSEDSPFLSLVFRRAAAVFNFRRVGADFIRSRSAKKSSSVVIPEEKFQTRVNLEDQIISSSAVVECYSNLEVFFLFPRPEKSQESGKK